MAFWPTTKRPTSLSSIAASTCISDKFCAITNNSGACKLLATVCPRSIVRLITMPFTGEVIFVRAKSMRAWASAESRCDTLALAALTCAWETPTWACVAFKASALVLTNARALSPSLWAMNCFSTKLRVRSCERCASFKSTWARETCVWVANRLACAVNTAARAASTSACAERTRYSKLSGSICASNCPALTSVLKSTKTSRICPLT